MPCIKKHKPITIKNNLKRNEIAYFRFYANFGFFLQECKKLKDIS